jgi:hypothetical protein
MKFNSNITTKKTLYRKTKKTSIIAGLLCLFDISINLSVLYHFPGQLNR